MLKVLPPLVLFIPLASAEAFEDISKIKIESETAARSIAPKLNEYFSGTKNSEINEITGYSPNTPIPGQGMQLEHAEGMGHSTRQQEYKEQKDYHCSKEKCEVGHTFSTHATLKREVKAEITGFTKDETGEIKNKKGYMDKALETVKNSKKNFDFLKGEYVDCEAGKDTTTFTTEKNCDQYFDVKKNGCFASQVVEIDPKYTYLCNKKRDIKEKYCTDTLKKLTCKKTNECDNGGIILSSVKTNLKDQSYSYPTLYVGTPYWAPHYCTRSDTYTTFEVKNLKKVKSVTLTRVQFDDHLLIKINGKKIYLGPEDDGDRLEVTDGSRYGTITTNGSNRKDCERATNWNRYPNIDLKEHLEEGENKISITLVTAGHGNAQIWINAVQYCCAEWIEERDEQCEYL